MEQKYESPDQITDQDIVAAFAGATLVSFSARSYNTIRYRQISFGDLGWWLPLKRVLPLIGITPKMLRPVFEGHHEGGFFHLAHEPFIELSKVLGKPIKVLREDGGSGDHEYRFTAHPDGRIVKAR